MRGAEWECVTMFLDGYTPMYRHGEKRWCWKHPAHAEEVPVTLPQLIVLYSAGLPHPTG